MLSLLNQTTGKTVAGAVSVNCLSGVDSQLSPAGGLTITYLKL